MEQEIILYTKDLLCRTNGPFPSISKLSKLKAKFRVNL